MDSNYDTWNLRHAADFYTPISLGVFWVPFSDLGQTKHTNEEMKSISKLSPEEKYKKIDTVYEVIQLFQNSDFQIASEKRCETDSKTGLIWEYQITPYYAHIINRGLCSEMASWAYYLLKNKYDEIGYLLINRPTNGHVINYVRFHNKLYFFDMNVNHPKYAGTIPIENGFKSEFYQKINVFTGILTMADSFEAYIKYHNKIAKAHNGAFLFCKSGCAVLPPLSQKEENHISYKIIPQNSHLKSLNDINNIKLLETDFVPYKLLQDNEKQFYI